MYVQFSGGNGTHRLSVSKGDNVSVLHTPYQYQHIFLRLEIFNNIFGTIMKQTRPNWKRISYCWRESDSLKTNVCVCVWYAMCLLGFMHGDTVATHSNNIILKSSAAELRTSYVIKMLKLICECAVSVTLFLWICLLFISFLVGIHTISQTIHTCKRQTRKSNWENHFRVCRFGIIYFVAFSLCACIVCLKCFCVSVCKRDCFSLLTTLWNDIKWI